MTQLILVTGFLGAGKTTLLEKLLSYNESLGKTTGIIVNEYGRMGIDGALLEGRGAKQVSELRGGSVFCACLKGDFVGALKEFAVMGLDEVIVEASGLCDPASIKTLLDETGGYDYLGAVCVTDAVKFNLYAGVLVALSSQIMHSSFAVINKTDIASNEQIEKTQREILLINPSVSVFYSVNCIFDYAAMYNCLIKDKLLIQPGESSDKTSNRKTSVILRTENLYTENEISEAIYSLGKVALRIKGFAKTNEGGRYFSYDGNSVNITECTAPEETYITVISAEGVSKLISAISQLKIKFDVSL